MNNSKKEVKELKTEEKRPGLTTRLEEMKEQIDVISGKYKKKGKDKEYKLPIKIRSKLRNIVKKNKVLVLYLRTNRKGEFLFCEVSDQMVNVDGKWRECNEATIYLLDGKTPLLVIPEHSIRPIGVKEYMQTIKDNEGSDNESLLIKMLERQEYDKKGMGLDGMNWKIILVIIGVIGFVLYILFGTSGPTGG